MTKLDSKLVLLVLVGATTLLPLLPSASSVSNVFTVQPAVPYFEQRLGIGPLSSSEMAYLRRLAEEAYGETEVTTELSTAEADGTDAWDNSCVSEPVNEGGFSQEDVADEADEQPDDAAAAADV
ncbi:uncharacterized protein LOC121590823 isoform X1 [Anopheles merus]|uniref:uncharacterized protein LOC121590823 isoform X1 n=1 Tax=Anopheles merus TaxID=30066 RepID=UPI001BE46ADB|nr:uncharacterized protein LOC121590823 isoform X1 [Anopheles merus]